MLSLSKYGSIEMSPFDKLRVTFSRGWWCFAFRAMRWDLL